MSIPRFQDGLDSANPTTAQSVARSQSSSTTSSSTTTARAVSDPSRRPHGSCFMEVVTVEVGPQKSVFVIHKDLLYFYSDYFRAAFNGSFTEAVEGKLSLLDERVETFRAFNTFIYTRKLNDTDETELDWTTLVQLWIFGDKHLVPALQNQTINVLMKKQIKMQVIPVYQLGQVYQNTLPDSPLRKLFTDWSAYKGSIQKITAPELNDQWPRDALFDLIGALAAKGRDQIGVYKLPEERGKCHYHVHAEGESC